MTPLKGRSRLLSPRRVRVLLAAAAAAFLALLFRRAVLTLLFQVSLAAALAGAARPLCARLERRLPAGLSALLALLTLLAALGLLLWLLLPQLGKQLTLALEGVPALIDFLQERLDRLARSSLAQRFGLSFDTSEELLRKAASLLLGAVPRAFQRVAGMGDRLARTFLVPALAFYFLRDRESFCFQLSLWIPLRLRKRLLTALREMRREIAGYFRGQMLVGTAVALLTALGLLCAGVPAWLLLGVIMGLCDLIPYAGPYLGAIPIVLFSLPQGASTALWALIAVIFVQQLESLFLSPHLMSGATGLHPAYVLLLLSAGGLIGGLAGMLLSLPLFVCLRGALRALQCAAQDENM